MSRPQLLDLFCGAGGAAMGYHMAGFNVTGVDNRPQPNYPFTFLEADALDVLTDDLSAFDMIHASPPCQRYMTGGVVNRADAPDLIGLVRDRLMAADIPWVIENVPGAPMRADVTLCGTMFGLKVRRHRLFELETEQPLTASPPKCDHSYPVVGVYGHPHGSAGAWPGMLPGTLEAWRAAMGIEWMSAREISQAIPPAYTAYLGWKLLAGLNADHYSHLRDPGPAGVECPVTPCRRILAESGDWRPHNSQPVI